MYAIKYENPETGVICISNFIYERWELAYDQCELSRKRNPNIILSVVSEDEMKV